MFEDPVIEELHKIREEIAAEHNYDMHAIVLALRRSRQESGRQAVVLPLKQVAEVQKQYGDLIVDEDPMVFLPKDSENNQSLTNRVF